MTGAPGIAECRGCLRVPGVIRCLGSCSAWVTTVPRVPGVTAVHGVSVDTSCNTIDAKADHIALECFRLSLFTPLGIEGFFPEGLPQFLHRQSDVQDFEL